MTSRESRLTGSDRTRDGRFLRSLPIIASLLVAGGGAGAATPEKATVRLLADRTAYGASEDVRIAAIVTIDSGWPTNSHEPTLDYLIATDLALTLPGGWPTPVLRYPAGEMKRFAFAREQALSVYAGEVARVASTRAPATLATGEVPVTATLRYQACSDRVCLPPVTRTVGTRLAFASGGQPVTDPAFGDGTNRGAVLGAAIGIAVAVIGALALRGRRRGAVEEPSADP